MITESVLTKNFYKTGEVAKMVGLTNRTIAKYCDLQVIKNVSYNNTQRMIPKESVIEFLKSRGLYLELNNNKKDIIYARVSTDKQKKSGELDKQIQFIKDFVILNNPQNLEVISEVASGLNDNREGLNRIILDVMEYKVNRIFISHKDRLTRFGFNYLETICRKFDTEIVIISNFISNKYIEELEEDIVSIVHSFSEKIDGMGNKIKIELEKKVK